MTALSRSSATRWRLRAVATGAAGTIGWVLVAGGTAYAGAPKPPPPPKPAPASAPAPAPATATAAKPAPAPKPAAKPAKDAAAKKQAQDYLKTTQQNAAALHKASDQADKLVGQANAALQHARDAAKKAADQLAKVANAASTVQYAPGTLDQITQDEQAAQGAYQSALYDAGQAGGAASTISGYDTQAQTAVKTASDAASTADTDPTGVTTASDQASNTTTWSDETTTSLLPSVQYWTDQTQQEQTSAQSAQQQTQQDAPATMKLLSFFRTHPYTTPAPPSNEPGTTDTGTGQPGGVQQPGQTGGSNQPGQTGGSSQPGQPGQPGQTGGSNQPGQPGQPGNGGSGPVPGTNHGGTTQVVSVPVVTVVPGGLVRVQRVPATVTTTTVASGVGSSSGPRSNLLRQDTLTQVFGEKIKRGVAHPGSGSVAVGRQHVISGGSTLLSRRGIESLGAIPFLLVLLLVEVLILGRRFGNKFRSRRRANRLVFSSKAAVMVPAPRAARQSLPRVRPGIGGRRPARRPTWKPAMPGNAGGGLSGSRR